jgi:integrase
MTEQPKASSRAKMTQTTVSAALKRGHDQKLRPKTLRDHEVGGLLLHVGGRTASWMVDYKPHGKREDGRRRSKIRMKLGDAMTIPLPDARTAARAVKVKVAEGRDPHAEKRAERAQAIAERAIVPETTADALDAYLQAVQNRQGVADNTRRLQSYYARKAIAELNLERLPLAAIDERAVRLMLDRIASPTQRWHLFSALRRFLGWARKRKLIADNPCEAIDADDRPDKPRDRDHVPNIATLRAVWNALEDEPAHAKAAYRLLLLLPLRRGEVLGLRWSEVDIAGKRVSIGAERMKARARHELPLPAAAIEILEERKPANTKPDDLCFATPAGKLFNDLGGILERVRKRIEQAEAAKEQRFVWHDVRRSFVSELAGQFDLDLLDQCLAHRRGGTFAIYQRSARWPERVAALNAWAALVTGAEEKSENVLPFRQSAVI